MKIDALILAGGRGSRLASVMDDRPKCLAPIADTPFLDHLLAFLARDSVVGRAVLALGYRAQQVVDHLGATLPPIPVATVVEPTPLGTGGAVLNALGDVTSDPFFVVNGDTLFDVDLRAMVEHHRTGGFDATMALVEVIDAARFGSVALEAGRITRFREKTPGCGLVNAGLILFARAALARFPLVPCSLETEIMPALVADDRVGGFVSDGAFLDIGLPPTYAAAADFVAGRKILARRNEIAGGRPT